MLKITLMLADNGVIKTITDSNHNGAGVKMEWQRVYKLDSDETHEAKLEFIYDLCENLGLDLGNEFSNNTLKFNVDWGNEYNPTVEELEEKVNSMKAEIKLLTQSLKNIK